MPYTIIPPTQIPNNIALPVPHSPDFAAAALAYVNFWVNEWVPAFNANAENVNHNALAAQEQATAAEAASLLAQAAQAALNATLWVSGGSYVAATVSTPASVVVDQAKPNTTYRCIANVSGTTPPSADPTHWAELASVPVVARENVVSLGSVSGSVTIDASLGGVFKATITGNTTFSVINPPPAGKAGGFLLKLTNAGAHTVTLWSGIKRTSGYAPLRTVAGTDAIGYLTDDGGATWGEVVHALDIK